MTGLTDRHFLIVFILDGRAATGLCINCRQQGCSRAYPCPHPLSNKNGCPL